MHVPKQLISICHQQQFIYPEFIQIYLEYYVCIYFSKQKCGGYQLKMYREEINYI